MLDGEEQQNWRSRGWRLEGRTAKKTLVTNLGEDVSKAGIENGNSEMTSVGQDVPADGIRDRKSERQTEYTNKGNADAGRLTAGMLFEGPNGTHKGEGEG